MEQLSDTLRFGQESAAAAEREPLRWRAPKDAAPRARATAAASRAGERAHDSSLRQIVLPLILTPPMLALVAVIATRTPSARAPIQGAISSVRSIYRVSAVQLYRDYNSNEAATQARIAQQRVLVTGTVTAVSQDYLGDNQLLLDVGNSVSAAEMTLRPDQNLAAVQLQRGQEVALLCDQMQRLTDAPEGGSCTLINPGRSEGTDRQRVATTR